MISALDRIEQTLDAVEIEAKGVLDSLNAAHGALSTAHTTLQNEREALTETKARLSHVQQEAEAVVGIMDSVLALAAQPQGRAIASGGATEEGEASG